MKQIYQNMRTGETTIEQGPMPVVDRKTLVIESLVSLISVGTERMLVDFSKSNYLQKAQQQPEKVKQVLEKVKTDGLMVTWDAVNSKLDTPLPLGYNCVGRVLEVGSQVQGYQVGDLVVTNGPHATHFRVSPNLCAKIPEGVDPDEAVFTVVASIGLQGIRLANPTIGESFLVLGAGLIGLLTIQLLIANGCRVLAADFDRRKLSLAESFGATTFDLNSEGDLVQFSQKWTQGRGVDGSLITASTSSSDPVSVSARACRKRGRIVLVGVSGLELNRSEFFEKELTFQVSCSYGPGRYDKSFEEQGQDYPFGYVRWTETRNFEAVLGLLRDNKISAKSLITHEFAFEESEKAFKALSESAEVIGVLLRYSTKPEQTVRSVTFPQQTSLDLKSPGISFIGAGNYASRMLIPAFKKNGSSFASLITRSGVGTSHIAKKNGFHKVSTDLDSEIQDPKNEVFVVTTQHNSHASMVLKLLESGRHIFVEKPLALTLEEVESIKSCVKAMPQPRALMVGYNRRFSAHGQKMKELLSSVKGPKHISYTMNAGTLPRDHWARNLETGGGRIVGEACHCVDFIRFLVGAPISQSRLVCSPSAKSFQGDVCAFIELTFEDGSLGVVQYISSGSSAYPKERVEVHAEGRSLVLDNFIRLSGFGWKNFKKMNLWRQDKGQNACVKAFLAHLSGDAAPIPLLEIFEVAEHTIRLQQQCVEQGGA